MRVLQINSVCGVGSTGRIATDLYKVLEEQGHECLIAYGRGTAPEGINSYKIGTNLDNYLHVARTRLLDQHGYGSKRPTIELVKKIKEYNPDIIHLHNLHGYYLNLEVLFNYLAESNKPVVWTLHDCWAFTGHCSHFEYVGCDKWKFGCNKCVQKNEYPRSGLIDNCQENFKIKKKLFTSIKKLTIITPSQWLSNLVKQSYLKRYPVKVIKNGIDLTKFKPTASNLREVYKLENKKIVLGVASQWGIRKGLTVFNQLALQLPSEFQVVLVGVTDKQKNGLEDKIICIPKTNSVSELAAIYSSADIFLNPTFEDTFPTTNLESLACGTPVITFDTGGSVESISYDTGVVVKKDDFNQLKNTIQKILKSQYFSLDKCMKRAELFDKNERYQEYIHQYLLNMEIVK